MKTVDSVAYKKYEMLIFSRDYQSKRVNPPYMPSNQGNPSSVIFRHGTQLLRGYYSRDAWTAEATFSKLPEAKEQERHCVYLILSYSRDRFSALSAVFLFGRAFVFFLFVCARFSVHYLAVCSF